MSNLLKSISLFLKNMGDGLQGGEVGIRAHEIIKEHAKKVAEICIEAEQIVSSELHITDYFSLGQNLTEQICNEACSIVKKKHRQNR